MKNVSEVSNKSKATMAQTKRNSREETERLQIVIARFKALWASYFTSAEGRGALTDRGSALVEVEKLRGEVFADLVRQKVQEKAGDQWKNTRIVIDCDKQLRPVLCAKIVTTAKAILPRLYKRQTWSLFKRHEQVLILFMHTGISSLDEAIALSDLNRAYEECGYELLSKLVPWIGVVSAEYPDMETYGTDKGNARDGKEFLPEFAYKVESVRFDEEHSRIIVKAVNCWLDLECGIV